MQYDYYINLNERGEFFADVREVATDKTVYEIHGFDIFEDGFMDNVKDMVGLHCYLQDLGIFKGPETLRYMG
jgi:hypothetical protein